MTPLVSVIICTYSRPAMLQETLKSILKQEREGSFDLEIIVVDNSPSGQMKAAVEPFQGKLRYLQETTQGKSHALNHGVKNATGEVIAFTDDDAIADPQWLLSLIRSLKNHQCDGVGGRVMPIYPSETPQWIKDNPAKIAGGVVVYDYGEDEFLYEEKYDPFIGCNYAFKRRVFDDCGVFRTDVGPGTNAMGEDTEFIERLIEQGKILYYCGTAVVRHPVDLKRLTLKHIAHWHIALGRFCARREVEKKERISVYYFGIPRYLWKGVVKDALTGILCVFNRIKFFDAWRGFFRKIGMIKEYSDLRRQGLK